MRGTDLTAFALGRHFNRRNFRSRSREVKTQNPGAGDRLAVGLRRLESPALRGLHRLSRKISARPG